MDTNGLIKKATEKLEETKKQFESDEEKLNQLIEERGLLLANELIESSAGQKEKIKKLNKEIKELKDLNEGYPPVVNGLKKRILSLKTLQEKEVLQKAEDDQAKVEDEMHTISQRLIPVLKQANKLNSELENLFVSWKGLSEKTGRMLFSKKILQPSEKMLSLCSGVMISEYNGTSQGKGRNFYNRIPI
ncbi:hypothetical protein ES703_10954 [subsurface metagenome]